jgi:hypothetical protein
MMSLRVEFSAGVVAAFLLIIAQEGGKGKAKLSL